MAHDKEPLDELEKTLKAILLSTPGDQTADEICRAFEELTFKRIEYWKYGFKTIDSLLYAFPDAIRPVRTVRGRIFYQGVPDKDTSLISSMVVSQKNAGKPSRSLIRSKIERPPVSTPRSNPTHKSLVTTQHSYIRQENVNHVPLGSKQQYITENKQNYRAENKKNYRAENEQNYRAENIQNYRAESKQHYTGENEQRDKNESRQNYVSKSEHNFKNGDERYHKNGDERCCKNNNERCSFIENKEQYVNANQQNFLSETREYYTNGKQQSYINENQRSYKDDDLRSYLNEKRQKSFNENRHHEINENKPFDNGRNFDSAYNLNNTAPTFSKHTKIEMNQPKNSHHVGTVPKKDSRGTSTKEQKTSEDILNNKDKINELKRECLAILNCYPKGINFLNFLVVYDRTFGKPLSYLEYGEKSIFDLFTKYTYEFMEVDFNKASVNPTLRKKYIPKSSIKRT